MIYLPGPHRCVETLQKVFVGGVTNASFGTLAPQVVHLTIQNATSTLRATKGANSPESKKTSTSALRKQVKGDEVLEVRINYPQEVQLQSQDGSR